MRDIHKVTFTGDHFTFTVKIRATNDLLAEMRAIGYIEQRYGFDVVGNYNDVDVVRLNDDEVQVCMSCAQDFAVRNGTLCSDCFRHTTSDYFAEFTK
jgi:hypothetical protein